MHNTTFHQLLLGKTTKFTGLADQRQQTSENQDALLTKDLDAEKLKAKRRQENSDVPVFLVQHMSSCPRSRQLGLARVSDIGFVHFLFAMGALQANSGVPADMASLTHPTNSAITLFIPSRLDAMLLLEHLIDFVERSHESKQVQEKGQAIGAAYRDNREYAWAKNGVFICGAGSPTRGSTANRSGPASD